MRRALAALLVLLSSACTRETPAPPPAAAKKVEANATHDGGRLVRRLDADVQTLNYVLQQTEDDLQVLAFVYDPLVDLNQNLEPIPGTAARWEVLDGGKTYVFHLDPRANFSDGKPVRASDVIFTLHKMLDEQSPRFAATFEGLDRTQTKALDDRTVRVVFDKPYAGRLLSFNVGIMPEHVYAKEKFDTTTKVVGNGPYVVKRREPGRSILLERRDNYWREKPPIASILFRVLTDDTTAWQALQRGDIDVGIVANDLWQRVKDDPKVTEKLAFHITYQLGYNCIVWNLADPLLNEVRVRRALAMAFDRQTVIDRLYHGQARAVSGPFTSDEWAANAEVQPIAFNPTAAAGLLSSAGWRDTDGDGVLDRAGKRFAFTLLIPSGSETSRAQAQVFQEALKRLGVQMEIKPLDGAAFFEQVLQRNYQAAYMSWVNEPDPDPYELFHSSQFSPDGMNVVGYANEEADQLLEEARAELDPARRTDLYHQLHDVLARDQPYLWTVQVSEKWAVNKRVQNVRVARGMGLFGWYPGPRGWWVK
jgi:peptide/nickel transport system substrate-binding protein